MVSWNPSLSMDRYVCGQGMSSPVVSLHGRSSVQDIIDVLDGSKHGGFPVVKVDRGQEDVYVGLIMRHQLLALLENGIWEDDEGFSPAMSEDLFRAAYTRRDQTVASLHISMDERHRIVSLYPYLDATVFTVTTQTPMTRAFQAIRYLGLRHVPVVDGGVVRGIMTRHEILDMHISRLDQKYFGPT